MPARTSRATGPGWYRPGRTGRDGVSPGAAAPVLAPRTSAAPVVHASQPSVLTSRPEPNVTPLTLSSPQSARNRPSVTALSPRPNSAPSLAALLGRATLRATSAAVSAHPI